MDKNINISIKAILFAFGLVIGGYIIFRLSNILGIFAIALLIVFALEPLVKKLMQLTVLNKKVSRGVAVGFSYLLLIVFLVFVFTMWLPPFISESQKLIKNIPKIVNSIQLSDKLELNFSDILPQTSKISSNLLTASLSVFSNLTTLFSLFVISLYMSLDWPNIKRRFASLFPDKTEDLVLDTIDEIEVSLGHWLKGESILMLVVGTASFVGLLLLDVDYPLSLGLISGFLEVVPMIGPVFSAIIAGIIALADAPIKALGVVILFIIIQQLENNILVPKVMQKVSGFSPLIILFALLVGGEFFGIVGAVLAVPATMILSIVAKKVIRFLR